MYRRPFKDSPCIVCLILCTRSVCSQRRKTLWKSWIILSSKPTELWFSSSFCLIFSSTLTDLNYFECKAWFCRACKSLQPVQSTTLYRTPQKIITFDCIWKPVFVENLCIWQEVSCCISVPWGESGVVISHRNQQTAGIYFLMPESTWPRQLSGLFSVCV